ncbi:MAG: S8 family peptidase [Ruminococcus sp.]|jgi:subtilisin family serine protease
MPQSAKEAILSEEYYDYIIPTTVLNSGIFSSLVPADSYFVMMDSFYGILSAPVPADPSIISFVNYSTIPSLFMLQDLASLEVSGIIQAQTQTTLSLSGKGVLIGFIDTGINYQNSVFTDDIGQTRIEAVWDQEIQTGTPPSIFPYGSEYLKEDINLALSSEDPYSVVPSRDENGHGTALASIAAGKAIPEQDFTGAAPMASIAVVKLKEAKTYLKNFFFFSGSAPVYQETDIIMGYSYLTNLARKLNMPLVVCIALGSNQGEHSGGMPLEVVLGGANRYISNAVIAAAGNEGNRSHHYFGSLEENESYRTVEILVQENTAGFFAELWTQSPEIFSVGFVSPGGETIARIPPGLNNTVQVGFVLEKTVIEIHYETILTTSGSQLIFIRFSAPTPGIWQLRVYGPPVLRGDFHIWLPVYGFTNPDVIFLAPDPYTTITSPGVSSGIITPGAYSAYDGSLYLHSGRGNNRLDMVKPDLCAPGVDVSGFGPQDYISGFTGTSSAAAITAGGAALIIEWGLSQNPSFLFSTTDIKNILIRGAVRDPGRDYPNREWGYGKLNIYQSFIAFINR